MKSSRIFPALVCAGLVLLTGCVQSPPPVTQNGEIQTQQGIDVGLKIYDPSLESQQDQTDSNVTVMSPDLTQPLKSPVTIHGKVSGAFFSEGVFPVVLLDSRGEEIARSLAQAEGEWMTVDPVPFTAELSFTASDTAAQLVFQKDNPSGLPENDRSQSFAVILQ
jgi:hypothetical protein